MERQWNGALQRVIPLILGVATALVLPSPSPALELSLRWTSVPATDGYRLYVGHASRQYAAPRDLGPLTTGTVGGVVHFQIAGLGLNTPYFFAVTAYNAAGESAYSNEKRVQVVASDSPPSADAGSDRVGTVGERFLLGGASRQDVNYVWFQRAGPPAELATRTSSVTSFVSPTPGVFEFVQVAFDAEGLASSDTVTIVVTGSATTPGTVTPDITRSSRPLLTATPTRSPTGTPTPTNTPRFPEAVDSTPTPTAGDGSLIAPNAACRAAIDGSRVTAALLVTAVAIVLGELPPASCPALDLDRDGGLRLFEVVRLVALALGDVPWVPVDSGSGAF